MVWRDKASIKTRLRYSKDVGIIRLGIKTGYDQYVKSSNGKSKQHARTDGVSREMKILRKTQKGVLDFKNTVTNKWMHYYAEHSWRKNLWAWWYVNRNFQNWKTNRKKTEQE